MDRGHRLSRGAGWVGWILIAAVPLAFLAVFFAWPAAALILRGFHDGASWSLDGFTAVFSSSRTWKAVGFTLAYSGIISAILFKVVDLVIGLRVP